MEEGLPEEDSEDSREGQLLHDYAAHAEYQREVLKPAQRDLLELNESLIATVLERLEPMVGEPKLNPIRESKLSNGLISGTPDIVFEFADTDHTFAVNDTKFGFKLVERADLNLQLRAYAILIYDTNNHPQPERVFVSITQPRLSYAERITIAEYRPEDIEASRNQIEQILAEASNPKAKLVAGEEQCRYCKAKLICPEFRKVFGQLVPFQTGDLSKAAREEYLSSKLAACSDDDLEKVLVACAFATVIKPQAHSEARRRIRKGEFTNYALGNEYSVREIVDSAKAISLLTLAGVLSKDEIMSICSLPIGKIEIEYRKLTDCTQKEAKEKINKVLKTVIETEEREPRIIRK